MFDRLEDMMTGGGEFVRAECTMLLVQLRRSVFWGVVAVFGGLALLLALVSLLIAGAAMLAQQTGWIAALAIVAGVGLLGGAAMVYWALGKLKSATAREAMPVTQRLRAAEAKSQISGQRSEEDSMSNEQQRTNPQHRPPEEANSLTDHWQERIAEAVTKNPMAAASGAFALLALLGPGRSVKMLGRGMMLASLAASVIKQTTDDQGEQTSGGGPTRAPITGKATPSRTT